MISLFTLVCMQIFTWTMCIADIDPAYTWFNVDMGGSTSQSSCDTLCSQWTHTCAVHNYFHGYGYPYCKCLLCQRDCDLSEISASACNIPPLETQESDDDMADEIFMAVLGAGVGAVAGAIPVPVVGDLLNLGWSIFGIVQDEDDADDLYNAFASAINQRVDMLIGCMDEKIAKSEALDAAGEFNGAFEYVHWASALTGAAQQEWLGKAFASFEEKIAQEFTFELTVEQYETMLPVFQTASAMYSLVAADYLVSQKDDTANYPVYKSGIDGTFSDELFAWINAAKYKIVSDKREKLYALPCKNGDIVEAPFDAWVEDLDATYIAPLLEYRSSFVDGAEKLSWSGLSTSVGGWTLFENTASAQWYRCGEGEVFAGFYFNGCQKAYCFETMKCVKPNAEDTTQACVSIDVDWTSAWFGCDAIGDGDFFLRGFYNAQNSDYQCGLECWLRFECCKYTSPDIVVAPALEETNWWYCFEEGNVQDCIVGEDQFVQSLYKSVGYTDPYALEAAHSKTLYATTRVRYEHIGCFADTGDRALNDGDHGYGYTAETCSEQCKFYTYFSLQAGSYCFCENTYDDAIQYGSSTGCSDGTGGSWANDLYLNTLRKIYNIPLSSSNCNKYLNTGSVNLAEGNILASISLATYVEIEFDMNINSLCYSDSTVWGEPSICGVFEIGDGTNSWQRYPSLAIANVGIGDSENMWITRFNPGWKDWGYGLDFDDQTYATDLTRLGMHHVYIAIEPSAYTVTIDGVSQALWFDPEWIVPSGTFPVGAGPAGGRTTDATLSNVCIRGSDSGLYGGSAGVGVPTRKIDHLKHDRFLKNIRGGDYNKHVAIAALVMIVLVVLNVLCVAYRCCCQPRNNKKYSLVKSVRDSESESESEC